MIGRCISFGLPVTQFIAALLWSASMDIPRPEFHRHESARRDLLRAMRQTENRASHTDTERLW